MSDPVPAPAPASDPVPVDQDELVQGGGQVNMVGPGGWRGTVPAGAVANLIAKGFRPETREEVDERAKQQAYGDKPGRAFLEGVARSGTFGLSDVYLGRDPGVAERAARNPVSKVGEIVGAAGGLGLTGVGSLAERAGVAAFGGPGILARAGAAAVRTGLEGGAIGVGQTISDVALSKDPMTAETIAAHLGKNVLAGAGTGALLGGGLSLAGSAIGGAINKAGRALTKAGDAISDELQTGSQGITPGHEDLAKMDLPQAEAARKVAADEFQSAKATRSTEIADKLADLHEDTRQDYFRLRKTLVEGTDAWKAAGKPASTLEHLAGDPEGLAEDLANGNTKKTLETLRRLKTQVENIDEKLPKNLLSDPNGSFQAARTAELSGRAASMSEKIGALEDEIGQLQSMKSERLDAIDTRIDALKEPPAKTPMLDRMSKTIGLAAGHMVLPGGIGAWLGREAADSTIKPVLQKILGAFADSTTSIADNAANLLTQLKPPASAMSALSDVATAAGVEGVHGLLKTAKGGKAPSDYETVTSSIQRAAADPQGTQARLAQELQALAAYNPELAKQVTNQWQLSISFLNSKIPPTMTMGINGKEIPPSDSQKQSFGRYVAAANDPLRLLKEIRSGTLMPETVETAKALHPETTNRIEQALMDKLSDPGVAQKLSYPMRLTLSTFVGPDVDATTKPAFVAAMQAPYAAPPPKPPAPKIKSPAPQTVGKIDPPTGSQRLTMK